MSGENDFIIDNIEDILKRVDMAARKTNRSVEDIEVIAVSKTVEAERIRKAVGAGLKSLGENRVQELCEKHPLFADDIRWHLIGHLQTNKVKYVVDKVALIHSVDRIDLARELDRRGKAAGRAVDVLVQVNVAGEESKFGISPDSTLELIKNLSRFENIRVRGLMTIAPFVEDQEETRPVFRELRKIFIDIKRENIDNIYMDYLSMGMSNDFEVAIEEGSNMVRIGTAIFGRRNYAQKI